MQIKNNELLFLQAQINLAQAKEMGERWVRNRSQAGAGELCRLELSEFGEDDDFGENDFSEDDFGGDDKLPDSVSALTTLGEEGDEGEVEPAVKKSSGVSLWRRGVRGEVWLELDRGEEWLELLGEPAMAERRPGEGWEDK